MMNTSGCFHLLLAGKWVEGCGPMATLALAGGCLVTITGKYNL